MTTARDIMNPKLLYIREGDRMTLVRNQILRFGVTGVPVLDEDHRPVGFVSLRDLAGDEDRIQASVPVRTVSDATELDALARMLAEGHLHHVVVVDSAGVAAGMVSALDVLRALTGLPPAHPAEFDEPRFARIGG